MTRDPSADEHAADAAAAIIVSHYVTGHHYTSIIQLLDEY